MAGLARRSSAFAAAGFGLGLAFGAHRVARRRLVLLGGLLVLLILGRGMRASREARALLLEAGDAHADDAVHRRRDLLAVLAIVGAIVLACLATLVFVLARLAANVG